MIGDERVFQLADIRFSLDPEGNVLAFPCELGRYQIRQIELAKRDNITWNEYQSRWKPSWCGLCSKNGPVRNG